MSKVILTDLDEVIFDWQQPFEQWIIDGGKHEPDEPLGNHWDIEQWLKIPYDEGRELVQEFNDSKAFGQLVPKPHVSKAVEELKTAGWRFVAITACARDYETYKMRWENLRTFFWDAFDTLHCVGLGESKMDYLARYQPTYWIEDKGRHAYDGAQLGHTSFLIDYPWNQEYQGNQVIRVKDWREIADHILHKS